MAEIPIIDEQAIFEIARKMDSRAACEAYLQQVCGNDAAIGRRVRALLAAYQESASFLEAPAVSLVSTVDEAIGERPGTVIGPYKLMEQIGEGGMGLVFVAEQQHPVRRKVAVKVIKPGMDTREVIARFEAERQALALMDHPNIAHVLDAGATPSGKPYFVMELVRGIGITEFCDANRLSPRERLELFVQVCQAVQHAHQKGVIHRDLKATNILVTLHDGIPVVKVIDFGVAKAIGQQLTDKTIYTRFSQMIGTPMYMSPEQAEMSGLDIDTRSDIYALGVLLYELLTGATPFGTERLKTASYDEIRRIVREEEPPRPSQQISTLLADALSAVSARRKTDPKRLSQLFRGELDWIVMKAMEKDRNRRYETASAFAADVQRYLRDEPVHACPPTLGYRFGKIVRRHRGAVLAASLVMLVLVGGIVGTTWGMFRATDAEADAVHEASQKAIALKEKEAAFKAAKASEREAQDQLLVALRNQARAERVSGRPGQRFKTLKAIRQAAEIRVTPDLRTEAIAALVLPDVEVAMEWDGFPEGTIAVAFDADFQRMVRLSGDGLVTVFRLKENKEEVIAQWPAEGKPPFYRLWMSPDGRFVAYGHSRLEEGRAAGVCVWRLNDSEPFLSLDVPDGVCGGALAFRPDGQQVAIGHADKAVSVYDLAAGKCVQRLAPNDTAIHLAFHPNDSRLAVACEDGGVKLFDLDTGAELPALRHPPGISFTYSVAWHPDGRRLAAGCNDRKIHIWDTETLAEVMSPLVGNGVDGSIVAFNHTGDRLGSIDWSGLSHVWDTATGRQLLTAPGFYWQFGPKDRLHGYSVEGAKVKLWRLATGRELRVLRRRNGDSLEQMRYAVVHAGGRVLAADSGSWLCFFDLSTAEELASVKLAEDRPCCFHESVGWITSGRNGVLHWPARSDRPDLLCIGPPAKRSSGPGHPYAIGAGASADGGVVAVPDGSITTLINRKHPERGFKLGPQYDVRRAAVSPDGRWVATCSHFSDGQSKSVHLWEADSGKHVREFPYEGATVATFSPDGRWLAILHGSRTQLWEVGSWQPGRRFDGGVVFSPDKRLIALSGVFGVVRLVELDTGKEVARLTGPDAAWYAPVCFTPDGAKLIVQSSDEKAFHVWDLRAIRAQLVPMSLDWEWPDFPPADPRTHGDKRLKVEIVAGPPELTREEKARQAIARYLPEIKADPDNAKYCNALAWVYLTAPGSLRDVKAALPLAQRAVRRDPKNVDYRNTLGVAYYRADRYREAVTTLHPNLTQQEDKYLAYDLYFLAMSHHCLGETAQAQGYLALANRWIELQKGLHPEQLEELNRFRAEATELLKQGSEKAKGKI
jgi:serine/threonine protein kinase/WD40 repeat protein